MHEMSNPVFLGKKMKIFSYFSEKTGLELSSKSEIICMKCLIPLFRKNKKNISKYRPLKFSARVLSDNKEFLSFINICCSNAFVSPLKQLITRELHNGKYADSEGPDQTAHAQSDQGLRCPLKESLTTVECIDV